MKMITDESVTIDPFVEEEREKSASSIKSSRSESSFGFRLPLFDSGYHEFFSIPSVFSESLQRERFNAGGPRRLALDETTVLP